MKTKKKSPKAVTLLTKIETSLSDVLDEVSVIEKSVEKNVRELLLAAQKSIGIAIDFIKALPSSEAPKKATKRKAKLPARAKKRVVTSGAKKRTPKT